MNALIFYFDTTKSSQVQLFEEKFQDNLRVLKACARVTQRCVFRSHMLSFLAKMKILKLVSETYGSQYLAVCSV